jgi:SNF2 domain-containing protein
LPHQIEAVYRHLLPQPRLRFVLADDPGAGKTIMAGLLLKELRLRGVVDRTLIIAPAPLTVQWQDELLDKFDERFEPVSAMQVKGQLGGNPWQHYSQVVTSLDLAKREEVLPDLLRAEWDAVGVCEPEALSFVDHRPQLPWRPAGPGLLGRQASCPFLYTHGCAHASEAGRTGTRSARGCGGARGPR